METGCGFLEVDWHPALFNRNNLSCLMPMKNLIQAIAALTEFTLFNF